MSTSGQGWEWSPDTTQGPARRPPTAGPGAGSKAQAQPWAPLLPLSTPVSSVPLLLKRALLTLSRALLFATPWAVAHQAPLSLGFPRQEHSSELPFPSAGDLPDPGIKPTSLVTGRFFATVPPGKLKELYCKIKNIFFVFYVYLFCMYWKYIKNLL